MSTTLAHTAAITEACNALRTIAAELLELKQKSDVSTLDSLQDTRTNTQFALLKELNTTTYNHTREMKNLTAEARQIMDLRHLGLQNIAYEKRHLEEEIVKCRQFRSIYQDIELVSEEEFLNAAPPDLTQDTNPHARMINRLKFEHQERLRLKQVLEDLNQERLQLIKEHRLEGSQLEDLDSQLDDIVKACQPIEKMLNPVPAHESTPMDTTEGS
ncbi:Fms-interacting protein-domain-containing protein [Umbelopsis sp. PMI_123]|nr:Fms-interacting protein-domain-containing protein [Umbelopsis sp. PMI_123]